MKASENSISAVMSAPAEPLRLASGDRFSGKIKWLVQPIRFGGDPTAQENLTWLTLNEHAAAVRWWTRFYYDTIAKNEGI